MIFSTRWRVATGAAAIALLAWVPAADAAPRPSAIAVSGGPCMVGHSVPLAGEFNQLYECTDDVWTVVDDLGADASGGAGPVGPTGPQGDPGTLGTLLGGSIGTVVPIDAVTSKDVFRMGGNVITVPTTGSYLVNYSLTVDADNLDASVRCEVRRNETPGSIVAQPVEADVAAAPVQFAGTGFAQLTAGDLVDLACSAPMAGVLSTYRVTRAYITFTQVSQIIESPPA